MFGKDTRWTSNFSDETIASGCASTQRDRRRKERERGETDVDEKQGQRRTSVVVPVSAAVDSTVELLLFPAWIFTESISNAHTDVNTASQRVLSVILHHYVSDTQFKVLDILTNMSILLGYQLPGFNRGFSPFAAAVTGFKLLANIDLNLEQAARLFGLLPVSDMKCSLYSVCYNDV
ncbi:hypothetical protein BU17DRAFT_86737 [Hysterangium stoloniferum]|nr:hypothetical protein BU17DRAFT_86737 [Hysterangium stoloniferum]